MEPFTIIYAFMFEVFGLRGLKKEVFAVIFGFWLSAHKKVKVPYKTIRRITGASKSVIAKAIKDLENEELILSIHSPGKRTEYEITPKVMEIYEARVNQPDSNTSPQTRPVPWPNHNRSSPETSSGSVNKPRTYKGYIRTNKDGSLSVPDKDSYTGSTLKEIT